MKHEFFVFTVDFSSQMLLEFYDHPTVLKIVPKVCCFVDVLEGCAGKAAPLG